jgi:hypothetical protein
MNSVPSADVATGATTVERVCRERNVWTTRDRKGRCNYDQSCFCSVWGWAEESCS